jgi:hypothetical protein
MVDCGRLRAIMDDPFQETPSSKTPREYTDPAQSGILETKQGVDQLNRRQNLLFQQSMAAVDVECVEIYHLFSAYTAVSRPEILLVAMLDAG